ncbi:hypothetical protein HZS55_00760 [Halosimplex rubrum]|uniref:Uncharacterized protein n=1 Tax=Halosimplex rubrum TaxID=869889 RepID=A0A7D5P0A2_9EURY|nr:hypothetical protein [Halosimplex rubrum]QLH75921.1 hypothetical protein HZS55_00760 [Halosimplex rubrum]
MSERDYDGTAGAVGGAAGAVVGTVFTNLTSFTPGHLLAAAIVGGATAYLGYRLVRAVR